VQPEELAAWLTAELPCTVSGGVHWLLNRRGDGFLVAIFNHDGIDRSVEKGEVRLAEARRPLRSS